MRFTNKANLPAPLFRAVCNDSYSAGRAAFSITELIGPARIRALKRKYQDHLTEDASDRIWSLIGQVGHAILERAGKNSNLTEQRLYIERQGLRIGGQIDLIDDGIVDYKFCSYHVAKDGVKPEWAWQLNLYRLIAEENGLTVGKLQIVAIFRDWSKMMSLRGVSDYPDAQVKVFDVPVWDAPVVEDYLKQRLAVHLGAAMALPECTAEERWAKPERWALMKKGNKRAVKLYDTDAEAEAAVDPEQKHYVEFRPGESTRCLFYCPVSAYCSQFREMMEAAA